jgi:PAS domain S-box-containing protein
MQGIRRVGAVTMSVRVSLMRTVAFATLYALAAVAGRLTVMANTRMSIVWPAAGVLVVWFCAQRSARWRWLDIAAMAAVTTVVTVATGSGPRLAVIFAIAGLAQVWLFLVLLGRWQPQLWGLGGDQPLSRLRQLWSLLGAAAASNALGAAVGSLGLWLIADFFSPLAGVIWLARNTVGVLLIGAVGIVVGYRFRPGEPRRWNLRPPRDGAAGVELAALIFCSATAYGIAFAADHGLPITFVLIVLSIWSGLRASTTFVVLHNLVLGAAAVFFTLCGTGPFATIADPAARALIAQLFVGVTAVVSLVLALGRDERVALLRALEWEKAELAVQREHASRRAELLAAIVDSMTDGVSVIDAQGRVVMRNDATANILGGTTTDIGNYCTPLSDEESAYARVIAGEQVVCQDIPVRHKGTADERIVTVTATRVAGEDDRPWAVLVLHDVTAERRHRDELAGFAGVVAHDLQSPLTIVEAWGSNVADALDDGFDGSLAVAQDGVRRVRRAATRMRDLINDLLTYTTTRDTVLRHEPLPMNALVNDIGIARADAAVAAGTPVPRFTIDELPTVSGDSCLLRQLLDNLLGNAIKYTAPEIAPHVTITARPSGRGYTEITVADNGIGVPSGQHQAIFGSFHRAHIGAGYAGTGLGLAICQRIVQRHGGTIRAEDNPGGGTRFVFTLPTHVRRSIGSHSPEKALHGTR